MLFNTLVLKRIYHLAVASKSCSPEKVHQLGTDLYGSLNGTIHPAIFKVFVLCVNSTTSTSGNDCSNS